MNRNSRRGAWRGGWKLRPTHSGGGSFTGASSSLWLLVFFFILVFATGGGSRADIFSLQLLRPLSILVLGVGLVTLKWGQLRRHPLLFAFAAASLALVLANLVPLPPAVFAKLAGRDLVMDIDQVAGNRGIWRPLTITPVATRNALWAMMAPFGVLVLGVQLSYEERVRMLGVVILLAGASALLGLMQILGDPQGPLYLYKWTNPGIPVGLFANRNHQALLLAVMLPMLAVWAKSHGVRHRKPRHARITLPTLGAILAGLFIIPLILVTGSRMGAIASVLGLLAIPLLLQDSRTEKAGGGRIRRRQRHGWVRWRAWLLLIGIIGLVGITVAVDRGVAIDRFFVGGPGQDLRVAILPTMWTAIHHYLVWGSGPGSFQQIYQVYEPDRLLTSEYVNHAHNDWLEMALTGGLPALALLASVLVAMVFRASSLFSPGGDPDRILLARLGWVMILMLAVGSVSDYPLRTPVMSCLFVMAALWCVTPDGRHPGGSAVSQGESVGS